jgi:acylphosphatase
MTRVHLKVTGRVQQVGFRYYCMQEAAILGLSGYARNMPDGSVEVEAQGKEDAVEKFIAAVRRGPRASEVTNVSISPAEAKWEEKAFVSL